MHYLFFIPFDRWHPTSASTVDGERLLSPESQSLNSGVATLTAGALYRGIVNLSGRSTTMDQPYYYLGVAFLALALISLFFVRSVWVEKTA